MKNKAKFILFLILIVISGVYLFNSEQNNNHLIPKKTHTPEIKLEGNDSKVSSTQKTNVDTKNEKIEENIKKYEPPLRLAKKVLGQIEDIKREKEFYQKMDNEAMQFTAYALKYLKPQKGKYNSNVYTSKNGNLELKIYNRNKSDDIRSIFYIDRNKGISYYAHPYIYDTLKDSDKTKDILKERSIFLRNRNETDNDPINKLEKTLPVFINDRLEKIIVHDFETKTESDENITYVYDLESDSIKLLHLNYRTESHEYFNYDSSGNLLK